MRRVPWMLGMAMVAVAAVGSTTLGSASTPAFPACPSKAPAGPGRQPPVHVRGPVMVPVTADAAELCLYRASSDRSPKEVLGRVVILGRARTRTLTQLLKMGRARRGSACIADPTVLWLRLPRGAARRYVVGGCHPAVLVGARGSSPLRGWVADALSGLGALFVNAGKARAPDLVGLPLGQAIRAAKRARAT